MRGFRLACFLGAMLATAASLPAAELFPIYEKYQAAIEADDWPAAKAFLASAKAKELSSKSERDALSAIDVISPKENLRVHKEIIDGDDATLVVLANVMENESVGKIQFIREKKQWKILSELWDLGGSVDDDSPTGVRQPENDSQREALRQLRAMGFPEPTAEFMVMSAVDGNLEAVKLFVQAGYSVDWKDPNNGAAAIVAAATFGHPEIVDWLIDQGADVNATDGSSTALHHLAEKCEATATIRKLIAKGAKVDLKTNGGVTAKQLAEFSNCTENIKALTKK
ncbi:MAG TPA: ankyrin repeat domain-containing protein [Thermoanaerobaculia bacterium]